MRCSDTLHSISMAYKRLADTRLLKTQDKSRNITQKKSDGILGWDSSEFGQENDFVEWMSVETTKENEQKVSSRGDSQDKYRRGFDWCTGLEDHELFRRDSLNEHYRRTHDDGQRSDVCYDLNVWPELKDDLQRQSLDKFIKFMSSPRPPAPSSPGENNRTCHRSAEVEKIKQKEPEILPLNWEIPQPLQDEGYSSVSKSSSQDSPVHDTSHSPSVEGGDAVPHPAAASTGQLASPSLQSLDDILGRGAVTTRRFHPHKSRQLGDVRVAADITTPETLGGQISSKTAQTSQFRAKLIYSKKDKNVYESMDKELLSPGKDSSSQRTAYENSLQRTYPGHLSLTQVAQLSSSSSSHLDNATKAFLGQPLKTKLAELNSPNSQAQRPRLLVMSQISLQESSYPDDQLPVNKPGEALSTTRLMSTLCPIRSSRAKKDTTTKVLAYQNDLLDTVRVNIQTGLPLSVANKPQRDPGFSSGDGHTRSTRKHLNVSPSGASANFCGLPEIPDTNLRDAKDSVRGSHEADSLPILPEDKTKLNDLSGPRASLQYLGQRLRQTGSLTTDQSTRRLSDLSTLCDAAAAAAPGLALSTASCEDLGCLSLLNLLQGQRSRCPSGVTSSEQTQLSIPRSQGFRPYNSMSPLQRAKNISFRRLHGFVAHLPDGAETYKVTAPHLPATRVDRMGNAAKVGKLETTLR